MKNYNILYRLLFFISILCLTFNSGEAQTGQEPAGDLSSLHYDGQHIGRTTIPANEELVLEKYSGNAMEISAEIDPKDSNLIELDVLRSPNREEYTRIIIYKEKGFSDGLNYASKPGTARMPEDLLRWLQERRMKEKAVAPGKV